MVFALDSSGYPAATATTAYEGVQISGAKALTITDPEPRQIVHIGDDYVFQVDQLPPTEPISGEIRTGKINDTLDAIIGDDKSFTEGEAKLFGFGSNNRGDENQVALLGFRQALDTNQDGSTFGKRVWDARIFPKALVISREGGFEDAPEDRAYSIRPQFVQNHLWQTAFSATTEGFTRAQGLRMVTEYKPKIIAFKADGSEVTFVLPTAYPAQAAAKVVIWDNGTKQTTGYTATTTHVVFSSAPTSTDILVCLYEHA
ncbi:MAG: hypothetical protein ABII76_09780 [Pseudomonadota bacterium]